ncbi:MAG: hypothetical protein H0X65_20885 [Gemmatimonadetes bacterium]|nr:hypothetical protein [Gemmatimonadota bacterium]
MDEDGTNVATIEWDETASGLIELAKGETEAEAEFEFGDPTKETNETVTVTDTFDGGSSITLGTVSVGGAGTVTVPTPAGISNLAYAAYVFTYRRTIATVADRCIDYKNTAEIVETEQTDDATVGVCGRISGGNTIGFWGNKNGRAAIEACINAGTPVYSILTGMNLVNAKGQDFNPSNHSGFNSWLQSADAANMSYMLSAQMAATWLNVKCGVNGRKMDGTRLRVTDPANPSSAITITQALDAANMFLANNKNTTASGPARTLAEAYKSLFDRLNNGLVVVVVLP